MFVHPGAMWYHRTPRTNLSFQDAGTRGPAMLPRNFSQDVVVLCAVLWAMDGEVRYII